MAERFQRQATVHEGQDNGNGAVGRNDYLYRYACSLNAKETARDEAEWLVQAENSTVCAPPLPENEASRCVASAYGKPAGRSSEFLDSYRASHGGREPESVQSTQAPRRAAESRSKTGLGRSWDLRLPEADVPVPPALDRPQQLVAQVHAMFRDAEQANLVKDHTSGGSPVGGGDTLPPAALRDGEVAGAYLDGCDAATGAWLRVNPTSGEHEARGGKAEGDADVTAFRNVLVESDPEGAGDMSVEELEEAKRRQFERIVALRLPCACVVDSGNKSVHAVVRVADDGESLTRDEWERRRDLVYSVCDANGLPHDPQCKNPSRLTRLAGAMRGGSVQQLLAVETGMGSFSSWEAWVRERASGAGGASDAAPVATFRIVHASDRTGPNRRPLRPALIEGLMRRGGKCLIVGPMKSHKSMEAIHLSLALATGGEWFGHSCQRVRVFYVNIELDEDEFHARVEVVRRHMGLSYLSYKDTLDTVSTGGGTIDGRRVTVEGLRRWIEAQPGARGYDVVVIDPIYKLEEGEETHETVNEMLLQLDMLRRDLDCSIVYAHHSAKGGAANKTVYELARGSGDFGGDADLVVGISELMPLREGTDAWDRALSLGIGSPEHSGYRVQFGPRSFADRDSLNVYKTWPLFTVDEWDALGGISQRGDMAHEKGGSATRQACQAKRNLKDEAVTKAVRILQGRGEQPTRKAVYEAMDRTCGELGIDRPTFGTFQDWTRRSDGCTHWRTGAGDALRECERGNDGRARYEDGSPVFLEEDAEEDE
ncbi:AAA family ATPase [Olsenella sp. Marseille-P4559]|uniref:AAA family ATPase n=1 Tax=Olsenella sp. Marseille-P4559 TaxID=2364795 RepID=UPI0013EF1682|nr:AAA family ATPase [Olsenella sp. Marseille-P4559]